VEAGVDLILVHVESTRIIHEVLFAIRALGVRVGIAVTLGTPIAAVEPVVDLADAILLLSRVTGEGAKGASFDRRALPRLQALTALVSDAGATADLQVAGGVNRNNASELARAGATSLALGAGIYRAPDMKAEVAAVRGIVADRRQA